MRKLFFILLFALSSSHIIGMQQPPTYEGPKKTYDEKEIEINALDDIWTIGWIRYKYLPDHSAEITLFEVDKDMRAHKEYHIGRNLFQRFINEALAHDCAQVVWTVEPTSTIDSATLCIIYEKIIQKLDNSANYIFIKGKASGANPPKVPMTLILKE